MFSLHGNKNNRNIGCYRRFYQQYFYYQTVTYNFSTNMSHVTRYFYSESLTLKLSAENVAMLLFSR